MLVCSEAYSENALHALLSKASSVYGKLEEPVVLIHPTSTSLELEEMAERDSCFHSLVTAITSRIDVSEMFTCALESSGVHAALAADMRERLCTSGLLGHLQRFVREITSMIETYGWFVWLIDSTGMPLAAREYMVVYMPERDEWRAVAKDNKELTIGFVNRPGRELKPRSATAVMKPFHTDMQKLRYSHRQAVENNSRPRYISSNVDGATTSPEHRSKLPLDPKVVNQANTNDVLEKMVTDHLTRNAPREASSRERSLLYNNLDTFVVDISTNNLKISQELSKMQTELRNKDKLIESMLHGEKQELMASVVLPSDETLLASHLTVEPVDLVQFEKDYQRKWLAVGLGAMGTSTSSSTTIRDDRDHEQYLLAKTEFYKNLIVHEILSCTTLKFEINKKNT